MRLSGVNPSTVGICALILPGSWAVISAVGKKERKKKKKCLECQCPKQTSLLPSQLFPFSSIVLTVLENHTAKGKTWGIFWRDTLKVAKNFLEPEMPLFTFLQRRNFSKTLSEEAEKVLGYLVAKHCLRFL